MTYEQILEDELQNEIRVAEIQRSMDAIIYSWKNDESLSGEEMNNQLEVMCDFMDGKVDYKGLIKELNLKDRVN